MSETSGPTTETPQAETDAVNRETSPAIEEETVPVSDEVIGRAFFWSLAVLALAGVVAVAGFLLTPGKTEQQSQGPIRWALPDETEHAEAEIPYVPFTNITEEAGIHFRHFNGAAGDKLMPEIMGGGCAFFDFDNDGDQDLLLINFNHWADRKPESDFAEPTMRLYQNDGTGHFDDVTAGSGLDVALHGMGVAAGDYDGDGLTDLFVTTLYANHLYQNLGEGKFADVTEQAGLAGENDVWSTSAAFFDMDNDRDLDLFVCNYVDWDRDFDLSQDFILEGAKDRTYASPKAFPGSYCYLYRNEGDGTFTDVSAAAGIQVDEQETNVPVAKALGVSPVDVDRDGLMDLMVANDVMPNFLFHNLGDGKFEEIAEASNVDVSQQDLPRAGMGIDVAYFRNNEVLGCVVANFGTETTSFFVSQTPDSNPLNFADETYITGIGVPSRIVLTFGIFFFDCDLDGRLDLLAANGHVWETIEIVHESQKYRQPAHLYWNVGDPTHFTDYVLMPPEKCGTDMRKEILGRGSAYADIDNDGDLDVIITEVAGPPLLLRNDQKLGHHWIRLKLKGTRCNREAIGSLIEVNLGNEVLRRRVMPARSYMSSVELPVTIGIGNRTQVDEVKIFWPDGSKQAVPNVRIDALTHVKQAG